MNISDIAKMAGVSPAAVSRYLNQGYISEEKKEAIRRVIAQTGYTPSKQAQTLRTKRTKVIGVVIPKIDSESISRIVAGISYTLNEAGYQTKAGKAWDKDIYSAWKRQGSNAEKLSVALRM